MLDSRATWPQLLEATEVSLSAARLQAASGDGSAVFRLLHLARSEAHRELKRVDGWFLIWPEWRRFQDACSPSGWLAYWPGATLLRNRVLAAQQAFGELLAKAARLSADPTECHTVADDLEDLLVHVWRCEREWRLDDRLGGAP